MTTITTAETSGTPTASRPTRPWRKVLTIAGLDLKATLTDRQGAFFILALPLAVIFIVGLVVQAGGNTVRLGVLDQGSGPLATQLDRTLSTATTIKARHYHTRLALDIAVRRSDVDVGVVIPAVYDRDLSAGRIVTDVSFVALAADPALAVQRSEVESLVTGEEATVIAAEMAAIRTSQPFAVAWTAARQVQRGAQTDRATLRRVGHTPIRQGFNYTAPANMILFIFINSMAAAGAVAAARAAGITRRMLATPTSPATVLLGIGAGRLAIALVQATVILVVGTILFGVSWGNPIGLLAIVVLFALVSTSAAIFVGASARTFEQALAVTIPIGIALGMLGGCMWPLAIVGPAMRALGHLTPHAWAVDALIKIGAGRSLGTIAVDLMVLAATTLVALGLATRQLARSLA